MTLPERVLAWVKTCPGAQQLTDLRIDDVGTAAGSGGLYQLGYTELERRRDILGNVEVLGQYGFQLQCVFEKPSQDIAGAADNAQWLVAFQDWVQEQGVRGSVPLPDGAGETLENVKAEQGKLLRDETDGTATYSVVLTIKFKKRYEV